MLSVAWIFSGIVTGEGQAGSKIVVSLRVLVLNDLTDILLQGKARSRSGLRGGWA